MFVCAKVCLNLENGIKAKQGSSWKPWR